MNKDAIKNVIYLLPLPISQVVRNFLVVFLLARYLPVSDVGIWGQVLAIHAFLYLLVNLNFSFSIARFFPSRADDINYTSSTYWAVNNVILALALVFSAVLLLSKELVVRMLFDQSTNPYIAIYIAIFILLENGFNNITSYFRAIQLFGWQSFLSLLRVFFEIIFVAGGIMYFGSKSMLTIEIVFFSNFLVLLLSISVAYVIALQKGFLKMHTPAYSELIELAKFGIPQLPSSLCTWAVTVMDRVLIGHFLGMAATGMYFSVSRIGMALQMPFGPLSTVYFTEASKAYDANDDLKRSNKKFSIIMIGILTLFTLFLVATFPYYYTYLFAKIGSESNIYTLVFASLFAAFFSSVFSMFMMFWSVEKRSYRIGIYWALVAVSIVVCNLLLVSRYGVIVPFVSSGTVFLFASAVAYVHSRCDLLSVKK